MNKQHRRVKAKIEEIKKVAVVEYKQYPKAAHFNPDSPDYVASPREEQEAKTEMDAFNYMVDNLKNSIKLQEEIYRKIENLDRPYLKGVPGLTTNVYKGEVKDYSNPTGHNY